MSFVQFQVKSTYSLLQSTTTINDLIQSAKTKGYQAIALTDTNVLYGAIDFYKAALAQQIKPIIGLYLESKGILDRDHDYPLLLIAKSYHGYQNLCRLSTIKMKSGTLDILSIDSQLFTDLYVITPDSAGELSTILQKSTLENAINYLNKLNKILDKQISGLYLGVGETLINTQLVLPLKQVANKLQLPLLALHAVDYLVAGDAFATSVLQAINTGQVFKQNDMPKQTGDAYLWDASQSQEFFTQVNLEDAAKATVDLANQISIEIPFHDAQLPRFRTPDNKSASQYLLEIASAGLADRFNNETVPDNYQQRLIYELSVINKMGFADYFLIIWDVMHYAHKIGVLTGPGRGSAGGSLVAYAMAITDADPIAFNLLFERFLNPERVTMPDIDLDIPDNHREDLLKYMHTTYGDDHMAQIITFGTLAAKMSIRDVCRVFGKQQLDANKWSKAIPSLLKIDLKTAFETSLPLRNLVNDNQENKLIFDTAKRIEGLPRHYSTHAAGIVLSDQPLTDRIPLQVGTEEISLTQQPMGNVEELGLLKMDFLGLRNLTILSNTIRMVSFQIKQPFNAKAIPLNDQATIELFQKADTDGVFQFESDGIKNVLRRLHPTHFEDIVAVNALYRPGPMENIDIFIDRKNKRAPITYPADSLKPILAPTYGILVYQEQVMQVAAKMGGFSLGEADSLRRAMSKKKGAVIEAKKQNFVSGAVTRGYDEQTAITVYNYIEKFANYGFNRSHAVTYSMVAFQLAYFKVHYPAAFFAALLNSVVGNPDKVKGYILAAHKRQITVLPPNINTSGKYFQITADGSIMFGLQCVHGLRRDLVDAIITDRQQNGPFKTLPEFLRRIDGRYFKDDVIDALVYSGALDLFEINRASIRANFKDQLAGITLSGESYSLFNVLAPKMKRVPDLPEDERLDLEAKYLDAYLSGHPVDKYDRLKLTTNIKSVNELTVGKSDNTLLYIRKIKLLRTKKGEQMAFVTGQDSTGEITITLFPQTYRRVATWIEKGQVVIVTGKVEEQREVQIIANQIELADNLMDTTPTQSLFLKISDDDFKKQKNEVYHLLTTHHGKTPVILYDATTKRKILLKNNYWVLIDNELIQALKKQLGSDNVALSKD